MATDYSKKEERTKFYKSTDWKKVREAVLERDNHECVWCKERGKVTNKKKATLEVDHINELEYHPDKALDIDNLRTLCRQCHNRRHKRFGPGTNRKENKWDEDERW